jgi:putative hydrolase of the HAD superfamily
LKIFFDVDGVLIDGWHGKPERRKRRDATIERDLGVDSKAFQERFFSSPTAGFPSLMHACVNGACDLKEALASVLPSVGYAGSIDAFVAYWFAKDSNVNYDVLGVVKRLALHANVELYLVTGREHYRAHYLWNQLGFRKYFKDILYSAKLGHLRGTRAFFQAINTALEVAPSERPIFFDDQEEIVRSAREIGWDACVFDTVGDLQTHPRLVTLLQA